MTLADDITNDIDLFLRTSEFAKTAIYNGIQVINVIFDNESVGVDLGPETVETLAPQALCKTSDIPSVRHGDTLKIDDVTYKVIGAEPDGTGLTKVMLSKD
jgi:hypothetical protein